MIILFGPAGAGKSVQGQILAAREGWRWLSAGQLLRDTKDDEILTIQKNGNLVPAEKINQIVGEALNRSSNIERVVLDGFPRTLDQARWLIEKRPEHKRLVNLVIVLEVPKDEIFERLRLRGRVDDTKEVIEERLKSYRKEMYPILSYFTDNGVSVVHIDGVGKVGQVHDRIVQELASFKLIKDI